MSTSAPTSVLRKSGSSSCLRQSPSSKSLTAPPTKNNASNTVTVINTEHLPNYSSERYYILSEIQLKAHSISFLSDWDNVQNSDDRTQDTVESEHSWDVASTDDNITNNIATSNQQQEQRNNPNILPPFVILYLLWKPSHSSYCSAERFAKDVIKPTITRIVGEYDDLPQDSTSVEENGIEKKSNEAGEQHSPISLSFPRIYIVVDRVAITSPSRQRTTHNDTDHNENDNIMDHEQQIKIAEDLIRFVAGSKTLNLKSTIDGITVGVSSNVRAAPGLEACVDTIVVGDAERRHYASQNRQKRSSAITIFQPNMRQYQNICQDKEGEEYQDPSKSMIGLIACHPDDFVGLDPDRETDAVQGLTIHVRLCGEWLGRGNILSYGARSQKFWRHLYNSNSLDIHSNRHTLRSASNSEWDRHADLDHLVNNYSIMTKMEKRRQKRVGGNDTITWASKYLTSRENIRAVEIKTNGMIFLFFVVVFYNVWREYKDEICAMFDHAKNCKIFIMQ